MAIFYGYFDAGGSYEDPKSRVVSVAGYVSTRAKWKLLAREWQAVLDREGVSALHMKHFAHSTGEFQSWKGDEDRRAKFLGDLGKIITKRTNRDFAISILLDGYRAVNASYMLEEAIGTPYVVAAWNCISWTERWLKRRHPGSGALYIFEKGDHRQNELAAQLEKEKIRLAVDPIFMDKSWIEDGVTHWSKELQAADFSAYEYAKNVGDLFHQGRLRPRKSILATVNPPPVPEMVTTARVHTIVGAKHLMKAVRLRRIARRPGGPEFVMPDEMGVIRKVATRENALRPLPRPSWLR